MGTTNAWKFCYVVANYAPSFTVNVEDSEIICSMSCMVSRGMKAWGCEKKRDPERKQIWFVSPLM